MMELLKMKGDDIKQLQVSEVTTHCLNKGFTQDIVDQTIDEYEAMNVIQVNQARTVLTFILHK